MRNALVIVGIAALIVFAGAWYAFNRNSTQLAYTSQSMALALTSFSFENNGNIPSKFTCDGDGVSPTLSISGVPEGTVSLALIVDDPDVPKAVKPDGVFDHWTLFNIPPEVRDIAQGGTVGTAGLNGAGKNGYVGPCPPREDEPSEHRYFFRLYALNVMLELPPGTSKADVLAAMEGHIIEQAELLGKYKRVAQ